MDEEAGNPANSRFSRIYPWFLCSLSFTVQFLVLGFYKGFGSVYIALQKEFNESDALTAWVGSISFALTYMLTPLTFKICNRYGFRITMFIGSVLYGLGLFTSSFAPNIPVLYVTLGLLFAVGESLCFSASLLILPLYFTKNWALAHGIALCGNSVGALAISPALQCLLSEYGFRKGFQIMSSAAIVIATASFFFRRPDENEIGERNPSKSNSSDESKEQKCPDVPLKRNKAFVTFITATTLMHFGYYIPFVHLSRMAMDLGISQTKAALLPGYMSLAQSAGKLILGKVATLPKTDKVVMYQFALLANCLSTTFCPVIKTYEGLIAYAVVFGLADGCTSANNMLVVGDLVTRKQLSLGYSVFLVTSAASFLMGPPVAGLLYDLTGAYDLAFFFSGGTAALAACVLFLIPIFKLKQSFGPKLIVSGSSVRKTSVKDKTNDPASKKEISSKSDSGISLLITDKQRRSGNDQSSDVLTMGESEQQQLAKVWKEFHAVWQHQMDVEMVPDREHSRANRRSNENIMQFCTAIFPLITDERELNRLLEPETDV